MTDTQSKDIETIAYAVRNAKADFLLEDVVLDEMRDDEVLVDMKFPGICHKVWPYIYRNGQCSHNFAGSSLPTV